ncbi:S-layer homology domain-containing protein [Oscillibacter valericigenes]|uniref:S-layer homology domain-containing protein n=1 Tax=Oscillibacter valericigenes TaxID=351091 RepID=UPI001955FBA2|nr:S-layer homology domain-containing protein [Oscillibacter valericigenes]MBM6911564.1 S-layer homology domain-containing protein [Oscillibacter valericigenes]
MKKFLSLVLALVMTMSLVTVSAGAKDFTDDSEITYKEAVDVISALGVVDGYSGGDFRPDDVLTRGAAAKIICNLILGPTTASALSAGTAPFKDVPVTNTFAGYITYCSQQGIISGYADGTFRPTGTLSGNAFMKMLLGALGYDSKIENYTGANWTVSVIKQAVGIGLDDGNDEFVGSKAVTRQEAALYAFNMLQATMVEYDQQNTIVVGDITINTTSSRKDVTNNDANETIANDNKMQFAERYFDDLKLSDGTDDFARPANVWRLKAEKIGTYAKEADASYTAKVAVDDIYADLDLGSSVDKKDVTVYEDGAELKDKAVAITKNDDDTEFGANGVLTEVFYDDDDDTVVITMVNTYVGTINRSVAAKGNKAAYVEIAPEDVKPAGVNGIQDFETAESFEDDAYVLYTYSQSADEVKSVALAEEVTGTVTRAENANNSTDGQDKKSLTIGGTKYNASAKAAGQDVGEVSVDEDYTIYLDAYGYMIYIEENDEIGDYALVLATASKGDFVGDKAELLFADGTSKVVDTAKNYNGKIDDYTIVTYRVDEDGDYTLKAVDQTQSTGTKNDPANDAVDGFKLTNDKAGIATDPTDTKNNESNVTSNSKTVFVVYDVNDDEYTAYTGIKNAPSIAAASGPDKGVAAYWYCKSGRMTTVMFIFPEKNVEIEDDSNSVLFLAGESVSNLIHDKDGDYYEYNAIVNGEIQTVKVDRSWGNDENGIYKSYSTDKYGVISKLNDMTAFDGKYTEKQYLQGTGIDKVSADYTVTLDTVKGGWNETITVADDAKIFYVDEDGNIESSSYRSISKDTNDEVYAIVNDYLVEFLVIEEVDDKKTDDTPELSKDIEVRDVSLGSTTTIEYYREAGKVALSEDDIIAILLDNGCTDISVEDVSGTAKWTYTKPNGGTVKNAEVQTTQVYTVTLKLDAEVKALVDAGTIDVELAEGSEYVAENGKVEIVLTHNTSTFNSKFTANSTDSSKTPVTASGTGDATGNKTQTITISSVGKIATDITVTVSK